MQTNRKLYQNGYRTEEENETTQENEPGSTTNTSSTDLTLSPEETSFKKRYGDLRTHSNQLAEENKLLKRQLQDASKQELKMPSTEAELVSFERQYPDVVRHIKSLAMQSTIAERDSVIQETKQTREELEALKRERGYTKILSVHPDFEAIQGVPEFQEWAQRQPTQIQEWMFESSDPDLCIKAINLFKAEVKAKAPSSSKRQNNADVLVNTRSNVELVNESGKRIWKASEINSMKPKEFEKYESELEAARTEGRIDLHA